MDVGSDVLAVHAQIFFNRQAQRGVQHGAVLGVVEVLAGEHGVAASLDVGSSGEVHQRGDYFLIDEVFRQIHVQARGVERIVCGAGSGVGKKLTQVEVLLAFKKRGERGPLRLSGDVHCKSLSGR